ncbi:hypothetical protein D082_25710 [Synechocystis sp. PCC 6714]|nr:hypothetical protein D082_25710 [Synechocystis sp. PCC 6714]
MSSLFYPLFKTFLVLIITLISIIALDGKAIAGEMVVQWQGNTGYQVQAKATYPDNLHEEPGTMVEVMGRQKAKNLSKLEVTVSDAQGKILAAYNNINQDNQGENNFLQFHFDLVNQRLKGWLDIGGVGPSDYFLKGQPGASLALFRLDEYGNESKLDHNSGAIIVSLLGSS